MNVTDGVRTGRCSLEFLSKVLKVKINIGKCDFLSQAFKVKIGQLSLSSTTQKNRYHKLF